MTKYCLFCQGPLNPHDLGIWSQTICWILNGALSSASLLQKTGIYAHNHCIDKASEMIEASLSPDRIDKAVEDAFEVLDEYHARVCISENDGRCKCP